MIVICAGKEGSRHVLYMPFNSSHDSAIPPPRMILIVKQCDLTKPSCLRCIKYGETCPGYRVALDMAFKNENVISFEKFHGQPARKATTVAKTRPGTTHETTTESISFTKPAERGLIWSRETAFDCMITKEVASYFPLYSVLPEVLSTHAVPLILDQYSAMQWDEGVSSSRIFGYHNFLPSLLQRHDTNCLKLAVEAWAEAYVRNQSQEIFERSCGPSHAYGKALRAVNASLRDPAASSQDTTLAAVWVLGNYEVSI